MGMIHPKRVWVDLTLTLDTSAYAAGDLLADVQEVACDVGSIPQFGVYPYKLVSLIVRDEDDQVAAPMDFYFFRASTSVGTENAAFAPSDALMRDCVGQVQIEAMDWTDVGGSKVAFLQPNLIMLPNSIGSYYVAVVTQGSPTQTASGIRCSFGFE